MMISVGAALLGWYLAYLLYLKRPELPQRIAHTLGGLYQAVVHKYYIDELYAALFREAAGGWLDADFVAWRGPGRD